MHRNLKRIPASILKAHNLTQRKKNKHSTDYQSVDLNPNHIPGKKFITICAKRWNAAGTKSYVVGLSRIAHVRSQYETVKIITCKREVCLLSNSRVLRVNHRVQHIATAPSNTRDLNSSLLDLNQPPSEHMHHYFFFDGRHCSSVAQSLCNSIGKQEDSYHLPFFSFVCSEDVRVNFTKLQQFVPNYIKEL
jgi:hypothetical protein